jgi:hypothetical protein
MKTPQAFSAGSTIWIRSCCDWRIHLTNTTFVILLMQNKVLSCMFQIDPSRQGINLLEIGQGSDAAPAAQRPQLETAVGFNLQAAHAGHGDGIGESASVGVASNSASPDQDQMQEEIGDLKDEIAGLQAKVRAAERKGVDNKDFMAKQSAMQKNMLQQKLDARLRSKQLELDGQVSANKRKLTHELQQTDLQAAAKERSEENLLQNLKIKVADEASKAQQLMQEAQSEKEAAASKAQKQDEDLGEMRAKADAMEAELQDAEMAKINYKAKIDELHTTVAHVEKESAKMVAGAAQMEAQETTAAASAKEDAAKLKESVADEAKMESDKQALEAQASELSTQLAKASAQASGMGAQKAQLTKVSGELLAEEARLHQAKYKEASEKEAFDASATRSAHELEELEAKKAALEHQEESLRAADKDARKQVADEAEEERAALKQDNKAEDAELLREMKTEAASDKLERMSLKHKLNSTEAEASEQKKAASLELETKKGDDAIKRREALRQVEHASVSAAAAQIKAEYRTAMERVNTLKLEDEELQKRSKATVDRVNAQFAVDSSALVNASNRVIAATRDAAEAKVKVLFKAMGIEKKEESAEEAKAGAASGEASAREKSAIERAMNGEKEAINDAIQEAIKFAASKEQEAIAKEQELMTELTSIITKAAEANTVEAADMAKINADKASAQKEVKRGELEIGAITKELKERGKALQEVHATLASTSVKVRSNGDEIVKLQSDIDKVTNANQMLQAQIKEKKEEFTAMAEKLHNKMILRDALKGQLAMVQEQLAAANKTELSLAKVKEVKQEEADADESANVADNKGTAAALKILKDKASDLRKATAEEEAAVKKAGAKSKDSLWSSMLGL